MLSNVILFVLFVLVVIAYVSANVIMSVIAIKDDNTITDLLSEQDYGLGKIGVSLVYWPTFVVLYIKSLLPIDTKSCFDDEIINDDEGKYEGKKELRHYTLSEILELPTHQNTIVTPENYMEFLKFANIANANKDVNIMISNECVRSKYLNCNAFYGVKICVLRKYTYNNQQCYLISCYNALKSKVVSV
jgi:hypothetical protein